MERVDRKRRDETDVPVDVTWFSTFFFLGAKPPFQEFCQMIRQGPHQANPKDIENAMKQSQADCGLIAQFKPVAQKSNSLQ